MSHPEERPLNPFASLTTSAGTPRVREDAAGRVNECRWYHLGYRRLLDVLRGRRLRRSEPQSVMLGSGTTSPLSLVGALPGCPLASVPVGGLA